MNKLIVKYQGPDVTIHQTLRYCDCFKISQIPHLRVRVQLHCGDYCAVEKCLSCGRVKRTLVYSEESTAVVSWMADVCLQDAYEQYLTHMQEISEGFENEEIPTF